jgi:predicted secreted protein
MAKPETPQKPSKRATSRKQTAVIPKQPEQLQPAVRPKIGRPSKYTPEIAQKMCEMLAEGIPLRQICRQEGFPEWRTVYDWMYKDEALGERGTGLSAAIARARDLGYEAIAEECLIIADSPRYGEKQVMTDQGTATTVEDMLGHRKLQIETRLKLLAKWNPKKYGDRVALAGDADSPIKIEAETQADKLINALLQNAELRKQSESR